MKDVELGDPKQDRDKDKKLLEVMRRGERTPAHSPAERLLCCFRILHVLQLGK